MDGLKRSGRSESRALVTSAGVSPARAARGGGGVRGRRGGGGGGGRRVYFATACLWSECSAMIVFYASVARSSDAFRLRLAGLIGEEAAAFARVGVELDTRDPIVSAMVTLTTRDILARAAAEPMSPLAAGLDVMFIQALGVEP